MPSTKAHPLKFASNGATTPGLSKPASPTSRDVSNLSTAASASGSASQPDDISSPHELTAFVETILGELENKFDDMSNQILDRMAQMSSRVDSLENSIQDLINGD